MTVMKSEPLVTKTRRPQLPLDWVARPRLSRKLAEAMFHKLVIVSAPAGYGKTTTVIEALRDWKNPVGWVSLDASDNAGGNFWIYFITALQSAIPGIGQSALTALLSPQPPPAELVLTSLINSISGQKDDCVIVLDDYHTIEAQSVHESLTFLIENLPSQVHLIMASRHDPPLPLARWRVKGEIAEMRAADLSFSAEEAATFIKNATGLDLSEQDLATLESRTEGWIAGLKMAALSLRGKKEVSSYIKAFSGSQHYILDYLAEEVVNRQSSDVKQFLLETSILERFCSSLCDAITGRSDSQSLIVQLESSNLFVSPLDDERSWYRYHQLFATILRNQLSKSGPDLMKLLHHRASLWYEGEGLFEEAISHALLGGDAARAADLLENRAPDILNRGQTLALLGYRSRLPQAQIETHPWLCVSFAWAALLSHQWEVLASMLSAASAAFTTDPERMSPTSRANLSHIKGHLLSIQGFMAQGQGDIPRSIQLSEEANRELSADDLFTRSANSINLAIDYLIIGDITQAIQHLEEAHKTGVQSGNNAVVLSSQAYLAETEMQRCRFDRAARICRETIEQGARLGGASPLPHTAFAYILLGQLLYEQNDLDGAEANLIMGIQLAEANFNWTFLLKGCLIMAKLLQARGNSAASIEYILRAEEAAPKARRLVRAVRYPPGKPSWRNAGVIWLLRRTGSANKK